jgi:hypothetical protein
MFFFHYITVEGLYRVLKNKERPVFMQAFIGYDRRLAVLNGHTLPLDLYDLTTSTATPSDRKISSTSLSRAYSFSSEYNPSRGSLRAKRSS